MQRAFVSLSLLPLTTITMAYRYSSSGIFGAFTLVMKFSSSLVSWRSKNTRARQKQPAMKGELLGKDGAERRDGDIKFPLEKKRAESDSLIVGIIQHIKLL